LNPLCQCNVASSADAGFDGVIQLTILMLWSMDTLAPSSVYGFPVRFIRRAINLFDVKSTESGLSIEVNHDQSVVLLRYGMFNDVNSLAIKK
jgi:hypothetical protein